MSIEDKALREFLLTTFPDMFKWHEDESGDKHFLVLNRIEIDGKESREIWNETPDDGISLLTTILRDYVEDDVKEMLFGVNAK